MNSLLLAIALVGVVVLATGAALGVLIAQLIPGSGGQTPPRPDQQYVPATNPAVAPGSTNVVRARQVIVFGPNEGVFVYSGTPALGNPPIMSLSDSSTDPFGNTTDSAGQPLQPGIVAYGATGYAQLLSGILSFLYPGATLAGVVNMEGAGAMVINSGLAASGDNSAEITIDSADAAGGTSTIGLDAGITDVTGELEVGGNISCPSSTIDVHNGNVNLNMASPPNYPTSGKTLAQTQACLDGLLGSMINRQLVA